MSFPYTTVFVALADVGSTSLVRFYQQLLQQNPAVDVPEVYAEFQLAGLRLSIFRPKASHQAEFDCASSGSMSLCFEVTNLESAIDRLAAIGYPVTSEITVVSHGREVYAYDPAGNRLILHEAIEGE
jgi:predicted enzyme related to lactoylglutathione lyase